jgi:type VI secretion system protein
VPEERLLERFRAFEKEPGRRGKEDPRRTSDSVMRHLQRILNTRQGNALIADDYGVPDFSDLAQAGSESVREIERQLRATIQKYEPRLKMVKVTFQAAEDDATALRFQIVARLSSDARTGVMFETSVTPDGRIDLRG